MMAAQDDEDDDNDGYGDDNIYNYHIRHNRCAVAPYWKQLPNIEWCLNYSGSWLLMQ